MRQAPVRGQCSCGEVRYEATGEPGRMWYCHCRACRKSSGVGFGTWIEAPGVRWLSGEAQVAHFAASPALTRAFCTRCGTVLPARHPGNGSALLPAGGLESVAGRRPGCHAFAAEHLPWLPVCGEELPAFAGSCDQAPATHARFEMLASPQRAGGTLVHGSCLCGAVAYVAEQPLFAMRVCHCSRCRRRSGSSFFVGLACRPGALRFLRGEDERRSWHMPGTRFYTGCFCVVCGAATPSVLNHGIFISAGSLDDDPGTRVRCHVYYGSRAPWVSVPDDLPRFEEFTPPGFDWQATGAG